MRSMSPVQIALLISVGATVAASSLPTFLRELQGSRFVEATDGIVAISESAVAYANGRELAASFPSSAPLTPPEVPHGVAVVDPPGTWEHPTWKVLGFSKQHAHRFSFAFDVANDPARVWFTARAHGDLNGDGITSAFELDGERRPGQPAVVLPEMHVHREIE
jgi:hypothetical protein